MSKKLKLGVLTCLLAALSTVAIGQSFTTFINARVTTQLDLQGTLTANGSTGTAGQVLTSNGTGDITWTSVVTAPGGSNTQVQFNNSGVFGGDAGLTYNAVTDTLTVGSIVGNGSGLTSLDAGDISAGTLPVARGGIGVGTLTGIAKGNGTSAFTAATSADVIGLWTGTCNSTTFLRADGSCQTASSGTVTSIAAGTGLSASPSSPITTTGTLSIDQAFSPTWSGVHSFTGTSNHIVGTVPQFGFRDTDATVDEKNWLLRANSDLLVVGSAADASPTSLASSAIQIGRNGTSIESMSLGATNLTWNGSAMVNLASTPTWSGSHTFTSGLALENTGPIFRWDETDGSADQRNWLARNTGGVWRLSTASDAAPTSAVANALEFSRSGTAVNAAIMTANAITLNGPVSLPTSGSAASPTLQLVSAAPKLAMFESDSSADNGLWLFEPVAEQFRLSVCSDSGAACTSVFRAERTGNTVDSIEFLSTSLLWNGATIPSTGNANTWTASQTFTANAASARAVELLGSNSINIGFRNSLAALNEKRWLINSDNTSWSLLTRTDTDGAGATPINVTRSGTTVTNINLAATSVGLSGSVLFSTPASGTLFPIELISGTPGMWLEDTDESSGGRVWRDFVSGPVRTFQVANDVGASTNNWMTVTRSGTTVDSVALTATNVTVNGTNVRDAGIITSGTLPVARGGTGTTTSTGTGSTVLSASPTFTGTTTVATLAATSATVGGSAVCRADGTDCPAASLTETSGSGSITVSAGCTTTPSVAYSYRQIGTMVTLNVANVTCTASGTLASITAGALPVGIRPTGNQTAGASWMFCNSNSSPGAMVITTAGNVIYSQPTVCASGTFQTTASGENTITYSTAL